MQSVTVGDVVAGFRIESLIGEGAMGAVYLADDTRRGGRVALKVLSPRLADDERFRYRFLRESQVAASLGHRHVVPTIASGEEDGVLFLAMAYVEGPDLRQLLRREGPLEPRRALRIAGQVADALDAAHSAGLVHRDVKPGNILVAVRPDGEHAYVCDFGLARHVSSASSLTGERGFIGTIDYVPPEQIQGGPVDGRADLYSLGCILFECLTGARPFERESELSCLFAHLNEPPPRLSDFRPELPSGFDDLFATALAKSPGERYSTCGELARSAEAALRGTRLVRRRPGRRRRYLAFAAAGLVAAGAPIGAVVASSGEHRAPHLPGPAALSLEPNGLSLVDPTRRRVVAKTRFGSAVWDVAFAEGSAWALLGDGDGVARVDLASRRLRGIIRLPGGYGSRIAAGGGSVWIGGPRVLRIDAATGKVAGAIAVSGEAGDGIAYGAGSLWLARGPDIVRVDPRTGRLLRRFTAGGTATLIVFADGALWAVSSGTGVVTKIDPVADAVAATARLHGWISDLTVGGGFVWVAVIPDGTVFKLAEDSLSVQSSLATGPDPERISFGGGSLWVARNDPWVISRLDPDSGARTDFPGAAAPNLAEYHGGLLWTGAVPVLAPLAPIAGQELRISTTQEFIGADPSTSPGPLTEQLAYATCANLLGYPDVAGPKGARLRPEIAAAMPTVSHDGRTYTFRIRPGVRFSPPSPDRPAALRQPANAVPETVAAATFKHTIERALSPELGGDAPAAPFASDIVGASEYRARKAAHISGIVAHGDTLSITLVRPAGDFLTRISMSFFCPVPRREPVVPGGLTGAIPSAGPYYLASLDGNRAVLLRNPNYAGHRPRRVARIVYTQDVSTPTAVARVAAGAVDYLPTDFDQYSMLAPGGTLERRYGRSAAGARRYVLQRAPAVKGMWFNTHRPLLRDLRLRRAVSDALDRRALAAVWGEPPADRYIPPAVPGFHSGRVSAPDFRAARRLAGSRKRSASLYFCWEADRRVAEIVRSNLARIGIAVSIVGGGNNCGSNPSAARADLLLGGFGSPELDPAPFLREMLAGPYGVPLGPGPWNDPSFLQRLDRASALSGAARVTAYTRLDDELVRDLPFAAYGTAVQPDYFSPRVGCKVYQGALHFVDLGAFCVRKA